MDKVEATPVAPSEAEAETRFRAVRSGDYRRGIRLEQIYWKALAEISSSEGTTLAQLVRKTEERFPQAPNITSLLRVMSVGWLQGRLERARTFAGPSMVDSLVQASPVPAFALGEDKRIIVYNQPFLNFMRARLPIGTEGTTARNLRLSLDVQIGDLTRLLTENKNRPVATGFLLAVDDRRIRGRLNLVLAPNMEQTVVIGYVLL